MLLVNLSNLESIAPFLLSDSKMKPNEFYLRYYVGHDGKHGHEFLEFELTSSGRLRYTNNTNYKGENSI